MKNYRRLQFCAAALLLAQLVVGLGGVLTRSHEIFPFASWFLFSLVPDRVVSYDVLLRGPAGGPAPPAPPFNQGGPWVRAPHAVAAYQLIQQLGAAEEDGDRNPAASARLRRQLEAQFTVPSLRYDLARVTYTLRERWKNPETRTVEPLRSFVAGRVQPQPSPSAQELEEAGP